MKLRALLPSLVLLTFCGLGSADEIYRCGPAGTAYSQTPCPNGARIEVSDPRTEEQQTHARLLAAKTEALGAALERDRRDTEAAYRPALAGSLNSSAKKVAVDVPRRTSKLKGKRLRSKPADVPTLSINQKIPRTDSRR